MFSILKHETEKRKYVFSSPGIAYENHIAKLPILLSLCAYIHFQISPIHLPPPSLLSPPAPQSTRRPLLLCSENNIPPSASLIFMKRSLRVFKLTSSSDRKTAKLDKIFLLFYFWF